VDEERSGEEARQKAPLVGEALRIAAQMPVISPDALEKLGASVSLPMLEAARKLSRELGHISENMRQRSDVSASIRVLKPREAYILEAQYDTIEVMRAMGGLLEQSLEVQGKQIEVLESVQKSSDQQTKLTRWVLGFAIAAVVVALMSVAASVVIAVLM
jgi:hypothetical protein